MNSIKVNNHNFTITNDKYPIITSPDMPQSFLDNINLILSNKKYITMELCHNIIEREFNKPITYDIDDTLGLFESTQVTKYKINKTELYDNYKAISKTNSLLSKIPKELLLNDKQFFQLILSEIEKVNTNLSHNHYIVCNNILELKIRLCYKTGNLACVMNEFQKKYGYNYFEFTFSLDKLFPFMPPKIQYNRPKIDIKLVHSIYAMDIWDANNWNYTIPLDQLIQLLGSSLESHFLKHIDINSDSNNLTTEPFGFIDLAILSLVKNTISCDKISIDINKITTTVEKNSCWKSGTGYGSGNNVKWDVKQYIESNNILMNTTINSIYSIIEYIETIKISDENISMLYQYIVNVFTGINILDFNKSILLYKAVIKLFKSFVNKDNDKLVIVTSDLFQEIKSILGANLLTNSDIDTCTEFIDMINGLTYKPLQIIVDESQYNQMISKEQFGHYTGNHLYGLKKDTLSAKSTLRIVSEIQSLKKNLPNSWDSSILIRVSKTNLNLIKFIITGPKDTPYHNGIFEFHACFPNDYPNKVPQVLIATTNGGKVRFNPNLYANGKVCLSLLGTWSGEQGESWNPDISTFLQVIISIQSLILVEQPYFNEPGYESSMNTKEGLEKSLKYTENIRLETIRVAMIEMIKNKIPSYENFISEYFKFKKDEIIETVKTWVEISKYNKPDMEAAAAELFELLN
jgi:ubiquitin-protein ligase